MLKKKCWQPVFCQFFTIFSIFSFVVCKGFQFLVSVILSFVITVIYYTPAFKKRAYTVFALSVLLSITNIFCHFFSQQPCITGTSNLVWCFGLGSYTSLTKFRFASYLLPVSRLSSFWTLHLAVAGIFSLRKTHRFLVYTCRN